MTDNEIWLPIPGYEGLYEVSNLGRVKSLARPTKKVGSGWLPEKILNPTPRRGNYQKISLNKDGKKRTKLVHNLVLLAFVGPRPSEMDSRHFPDQNGANNYLINLSYSTKSVNAQDRVLIGTQRKGVPDSKGEKNGRAKLTEEEVQAIFYDNELHREIAKKFGISNGLVSMIKSGTAWSHLKLKS